MGGFALHLVVRSSVLPSVQAVAVPVTYGACGLRDERGKKGVRSREDGLAADRGVGRGVCWKRGEGVGVGAALAG